MNSPDRRDPVDVLADLMPPAGWDQPVDLAVDAEASRLLAKVLDGPVPPYRSTRRRRRTITGFGVGIAMIAAGTAVAAFWPRTSPTEARSVSCWSSVENPPEQQVVLAWDGIADPVTMCQQQWELDRFDVQEPPDDLNACTSSEGIAVVVPGLCEVAGLALFVPVVDETVLAISEVATRLGELLNGETCRTVTDARLVIEQVLDEADFDGWTIEVAGGASPNDTCATVALEASTKSVFIITIPPPP